MTFAREKRLLLGLVALVVALPLPLNDALEWPVLGLFLAVVGLFLRRAWQGSERWLANRELNLLGLAYLPLLVIDVGVSGRVQFVRPVLHLILFGLSAKLWSLERERDKWQIWIGLFFLFLAAMSTSTHPSVVAYLLVFLALAVVLLIRFVHLHVLSSLGARGAAAGRLPLTGFVALLVVATVALAAPLFALLPRVRTPMLTGPGNLGAQPVFPQAGFSDEMSLDLIGRIRDNPEVALRFRAAGRTPQPETLRLKATVFELWEGRTWKQLQGGDEILRDRGSGLFQLALGRTEGRIQVELEPLRSRSLFLPLETLAVEIDLGRLQLDHGGTLRLPGPPARPVTYEARLGGRPLSLGSGPPFAATGGALDPGGVTPRLRELAERWAESGTDLERAARIERRLLTEYSYTTALVGRGGESPIEAFLFESRRGHCEYFASSMVLLLRAVGIPSRLVTGFYGAEWSAWERSWIVRQSNAHAWVEAWIDGEGWRVFDPTPPDGRPMATPRNFALYARQAWEAVLFRWDRWVISYDFDDQVGVLGELRGLWDRFFERLFERDRGAETGGAAEQLSRAPGAMAPFVPPARRGLWAAAAALALAAAAVAGWHWRRRPRWTPATGYSRLRRALAGAGLEVPDSLPPLELARLAAHRVPEGRDAARRLIQVYVREAFAGVAASPSELPALRADLAAVERALRRLPRRGGGAR